MSETRKGDWVIEPTREMSDNGELRLWNIAVVGEDNPRATFYVEAGDEIFFSRAISSLMVTTYSNGYTSGRSISKSH